MNYFYIYVLKSLKNNNYYVGFTRNFANSLNVHNEGKVMSTKNRIPFQLVYWEGCLNQKDATLREKYLKTAWGKRYIKNRIKNYLTG
jgi:putative endonuclease